MKPRLVLVVLMPRDVVARACEEFDTVGAPGPADMTLAPRPRGAVPVNGAHGGLVDEDALHDALTTGRRVAAGLDLFRNEPDFDTRFTTLPNAIPSPHIGSGSLETCNAMGFRALDDIAAVLAGRGPIDPLWS